MSSKPRVAQSTSESAKHAPASSPTRRLAELVALGLAFGLAIRIGWLQCPSARWLGLPCPGCGTTRAALALARGKLTEAIHWNPAAPALVPAVAALLTYCAFHFVRDGRSRLNDAGPRRASLAVGAVLTLIWALRWLGMLGGPLSV